MKGFVSLELKDSATINRFSGCNTFQDYGKLKVIQHILNVAGGNSGSIKLGTSPTACVPTKIYTNNGSPEYGGYGLATVDQTHYKKYNTTTLTQISLPGAYNRIILTDNILIMASRLIPNNMVGRTWRHSIDTPATRWFNEFYDTGYTGSSTGRAVFAGTYTGATSNYYIAQLVTSGAIGVSTYRIQKVPYDLNSLSLPLVLDYSNAGSALNAVSGVRIKDDFCWMYSITNIPTLTSSNLICLSVGTTMSSEITTAKNSAWWEPSATSGVFGIADLRISSNKYVAWFVTGGTAESRVVKATYDPALDTFAFEVFNIPVIQASSGVTITASRTFESIFICPTTGDVFAGTDGQGVFKYTVGTGVWSHLAGLETKTLMFTSMTMDANRMLYLVTSSSEVIKYNTITNAIVSTFTTVSTPSLYSTIAEGSNIQRADLLFCDSSNNIWVTYFTTAKGISKISADGVTITHYRTAASAQSGIVTKNIGMGPTSTQISAISEDNYGRIIALSYSGSEINVFENGNWSYYKHSTTYTAYSPHTLAITNNNVLISGSSYTQNGVRLVAIPTPSVSLGWDGANWVHTSTGTKATHTSADATIDGLTLAFESGMNYVADDFFSVVAAPGIVKDNLQELTIRYAWYTANLKHTLNESFTVTLTYTLACAVDATFLVAETSEYANWSATLNGVAAVIQTTAITAPGQIQIADSGLCTFHATDVGKTCVISYYWLKE